MKLGMITGERKGETLEGSIKNPEGRCATLQGLQMPPNPDTGQVVHWVVHLPHFKVNVSNDHYKYGHLYYQKIVCHIRVSRCHRRDAHPIDSRRLSGSDYQFGTSDSLTDHSRGVVFSVPHYPIIQSLRLVCHFHPSS